METIKTIWFEQGHIYMLSSEDKVYSRPLEAFSILMEATERERQDYTIGMRGTAIRWASLDEDVHISSFHKTAEPQHDNEIARIFKRFPQLSTSRIAQSLGIDKTLLSKYIYGVQTPSPERVTQIKEALHALGNELVAV